PLRCTTYVSVVTRFFRLFLLLARPTPSSTLFPYTTLFRSIWAMFRVALGPLNLSHSLSRSRRSWPASSGRIELLPRHVLMGGTRSEEHTSELQSLRHLVCRLLLEKKKQIKSRLSFNSEPSF